MFHNACIITTYEYYINEWKELFSCFFRNKIILINDTETYTNDFNDNSFFLYSQKGFYIIKNFLKKNKHIPIIILHFSEDFALLKEWYLDLIRMNNILNPVIVFGITNENLFLEKMPIFNDASHNSYIPPPWKLKKFFHSLKTLYEYDEDTLKLELKTYYNDDVLEKVRIYLHSVKGLDEKNDLEILKEVVILLKHSEFEELSLDIENMLEKHIEPKKIKEYILNNLILEE